MAQASLGVLAQLLLVMGTINRYRYQGLRKVYGMRTYWFSAISYETEEYTYLHYRIIERNIIFWMIEKYYLVEVLSRSVSYKQHDKVLNTKWKILAAH